MKSMPQSFMRLVCPFPLIDGTCLPSIDVVGGIWVLWDSSKIVIEHLVIKKYSISINGWLKFLKRMADYGCI